MLFIVYNSIYEESLSIEHLKDLCDDRKLVRWERSLPTLLSCNSEVMDKGDLIF